MALSGTLETFSLPDVLRLLASTKKTGLLALDGDRGSGWLWVEDGELVAASADRSVVDDVDAVLFELLRFGDASFEFDATAPAPGAGDPRDVEGALEVAGRRLEEWRDIETVVPSLDVRVRMVTEIDGEISVTADVWRLLACVGAGASGHDVARQLAQGEYEVCSALRDLVERDLIEVDVDVDVHPVTEDDEPGAPAADEPVPAVADAFAAMVSAPETDPVPVYEVPEAPVAHLAAADRVGEPEAESRDRDPFAIGVDPDAADDDEPLSELSLLSPRAAAAVEATWDAPPAAADDAEPAAESGGDAVDAGEGGDDLDQNLLLRFLSSTKP